MKQDDIPKIAKRWDAGEIGCGHLIVQLRRELMLLGSGDLLEVVALDSGAPIDIPAWCSMTGHDLVSAEHPIYVIEK